MKVPLGQIDAPVQVLEPTVILLTMPESDHYQFIVKNITMIEQNGEGRVRHLFGNHTRFNVTASCLFQSDAKIQSNSVIVQFTMNIKGEWYYKIDLELLDPVVEKKCLY